MPSLTIEYPTEVELERTIAYFAELQSVASGAVKATWGNTEVAKSRVAAGREAILTRGKIRRERWQAEMIAEMPAGRSTDPLHMAAYLAKHPSRLDYAERLAEAGASAAVRWRGGREATA